MGYLRRWGQAINDLFGSKYIALDEWTTEKAVLPGGMIRIVSSDPNAFRGMEADITLDEFAFHDRQDELYAAAQSRIQWLPDGQVTLISSHSHPESTFAKIVDDAAIGRNHFSLHEVTLEKAVEEGLAVKVPGPHQKKLIISREWKNKQKQKEKANDGQGKAGGGN